MTDGQLSEAATFYIGEPVELRRFVGTLTDEGKAVRTAELLELTTRTSPRARVTVEIEHQNLDDLAWEEIRYHVVRPMRDALVELRGRNN